MTDMNNIPTKLREELTSDPQYQLCIYHNSHHGPHMKIEWHHNLIFAGRQVQEKWCILPVCVDVHLQANNTEVRQQMDWIMLSRATLEELRRYSKAVDLVARRKQLNKIYGKR